MCIISIQKLIESARGNGQYNLATQAELELNALVKRLIEIENSYTRTSR